MNKVVFDAIYAFMHNTSAFVQYTIEGYYGFAYLTIGWADGYKRYRFTAVEKGDGYEVLREQVPLLKSK
jgi:hypothetical protein